jgi:hypothetical protein
MRSFCDTRLDSVSDERYNYGGRPPGDGFIKQKGNLCAYDNPGSCPN